MQRDGVAANVGKPMLAVCSNGLVVETKRGKALVAGFGTRAAKRIFLADRFTPVVIKKKEQRDVEK